MRLPHNSHEGQGGEAGGSQRCPKGGHGRGWRQHAAIGGVLRSQRATHSRAAGCGAGRAVTSARESTACVPVVSVVETASPRCTRPSSGEPGPRRKTRSRSPLALASLSRDQLFATGATGILKGGGTHSGTRAQCRTRVSSTVCRKGRGQGGRAVAPQGCG